MMMQRWKMVVEYDGQPFHGWQRQPDNEMTVQGIIEKALVGFCQQPIPIQCAGRTDAGVHARGQVFHVDLPIRARDLSGFETMKAINAHMHPQPIAILSAEKAAPDFHARYHAVNKLYTYRILRRSGPPTTEAGRMWHHRRDLDVDAMRAAAKHLLGTHDFTTFRDAECQAKSPIKTLDRLDIETKDWGYGATEILVHAEGRSFLHHQVRNMVGSLSYVGDGKWQPDDMKTALEARDRREGGPTAPAEGLCLVRVDY